MQSFEDFLAQVVERLLANILHDADLQVLHSEAQQQCSEESKRYQGNSVQGVLSGKRTIRAGNDIFVYPEAEQVRPDDLKRPDEKR